MLMKLCGEIMIPLERFPQLPYWFTLRQAMAELDRVVDDVMKRHCPHCPCRLVLVFNAQNQLLGILRQQDILRGLKPAILAGDAQRHTESLFDVKVDPNLYKFYGGHRALTMLHEQTERPIGDFARPIEVLLNYDDDLLQAVALMIDEDLDFIPVQRDNRIAGIVTVLDVLQETTKLLL
jgi:CBS-domain-containing membrane protein